MLPGSEWRVQLENWELEEELPVAECQRGKAVDASDPPCENRLYASHSPEVKACAFHIEIKKCQMVDLKTSDKCLNVR